MRRKSDFITHTIDDVQLQTPVSARSFSDMARSERVDASVLRII